MVGPRAKVYNTRMISWDHVLDALASAASSNTGPVSTAADVAQLRAACRALSAWATPLSEVPDMEREDFLRVVPERLKDRIPANAFLRREVRDPDYRVFRYSPYRDRRHSRSHRADHRPGR
jgi:hypothetical protein